MSVVPASARRLAPVSSSSSALASFNEAVSRPSENQSYTGCSSAQGLPGPGRPPTSSWRCWWRRAAPTSAPAVAGRSAAPPAARSRPRHPCQHRQHVATQPMELGLGKPLVGRLHGLECFVQKVEPGRELTETGMRGGKAGQMERAAIGALAHPQGAAHQLDAALQLACLRDQGAPDETRPLLPVGEAVLDAVRHRLLGVGRGRSRIGAERTEQRRTVERQRGGEGQSEAAGALQRPLRDRHGLLRISEHPERSRESNQCGRPVVGGKSPVGGDRRLVGGAQLERPFQVGAPIRRKHRRSHRVCPMNRCPSAASPGC